MENVKSGTFKWPQPWRSVQQLEFIFSGKTVLSRRGKALKFIKDSRSLSKSGMKLRFLALAVLSRRMDSLSPASSNDVKCESMNVETQEEELVLPCQWES